jgi:hypothetical protein
MHSLSEEDQTIDAGTLFVAHASLFLAAEPEFT